MKTRYRCIGDHRYEVLRQVRPGEPWILLGIVQRSGSLPSMQGWRALLAGDSPFGWMPKRRTRKLAAADLEARS
jgi:hypothetical protein